MVLDSSLRSLLLISILPGVIFGHGLSTAEINLFVNNGSQGGSVSVTTTSTTYTITANGLPDHQWQRVNPNNPTVQSFSLTVKKNVAVNTSSKKCLPMGVIGFTKHGVAVFNLLTAEYANAVEGPNAETFDNCDGHPTNRGVYHYHKLPSSCVYSGATDEFLGVAIDGIPFYGPKVSWQTADLTSSDLDDCNGKTVNGEYRYYVTRDWPYYMGCLRGEVIDPTYSSTVNSYTCGTTSVFDACGYLCPCANVQNFKDTTTCSADNNRLSWMAMVVIACVILRME